MAGLICYHQEGSGENALSHFQEASRLARVHGYRLDTTTNFVEHPELIAQRIANYANIVGRENVMASSDCGFGTSAWGRKVEANIAWAKLASMVEGAQLASQELW